MSFSGHHQRLVGRNVNGQRAHRSDWEYIGFRQTPQPPHEVMHEISTR